MSDRRVLFGQFMRVAMSQDNENEESVAEGAAGFETTHWSLVLAAGRGASPDARRALAELCRAYWYPLYAYVRRRVGNIHDSRDLTQAFFARLLEKEYLKDIDRRRGKFRSFLLAALKHFLSKERDRARAQKRGSGRIPLSLDFRAAEGKYKLEPAHKLTPERLYQRRWALTLLGRVVTRLEGEFTGAGKLGQFERLKEFLTREPGTPPYRQVAAELAMTEGAVKAAVHRLRRRYRKLIREEIARTVASPEEIDDELRELFAAVRSEKNG